MWGSHKEIKSTQSTWNRKRKLCHTYNVIFQNNSADFHMCQQSEWILFSSGFVGGGHPVIVHYGLNPFSHHSSCNYDSANPLQSNNWTKIGPWYAGHSTQLQAELQKDSSSPVSSHRVPKPMHQLAMELNCKRFNPIGAHLKWLCLKGGEEEKSLDFGQSTSQQESEGDGGARHS